LKFIQVIEESRDIEEARAEIEGLIKTLGDETTVKNLVLCADRDVPGKIVTIVEFDSWESADQNNQVDEIQETAADAQENNGATYQNLDVHHEWSL
tara:strand:- start:806 stop:1093 length:288 start_codon:yes stop_codon:yes gene_type:complete